VSINFIKKECPDCGMPMSLTTDDFLWFCTDHVNCGYTEYCEDGKPPEEAEQDEEESEFRCPHCQKVITEELLP